VTTKNGDGARGVAKKALRLKVNGHERETLAPPQAILLDVLRENFNLTGTKRGCDLGTCGCCTVIVDGEARLACLTLAATVAGRDVRTVESLADATHLHPLQACFAEAGGSQCGFCTPGFLMTTKALLDRTPDPTDIEIREAIAGNLCRCTGYVKILEAVRQASRELTLAREPLARESAPKPFAKVGGGRR